MTDADCTEALATSEVRVSVWPWCSTIRCAEHTCTDPSVAHLEWETAGLRGVFEPDAVTTKQNIACVCAEHLPATVHEVLSRRDLVTFEGTSLLVQLAPGFLARWAA